MSQDVYWVIPRADTRVRFVSYLYLAWHQVRIAQGSECGMGLG